MIGRNTALLCLAGALGAPGALAAPPELIVADVATDRLIADGFGVSDYTLQRIDVTGNLGRSLALTVSLDGVDTDLVLEPNSLRTADFKLLVDDGTGRLVEMAPPPSRTYRAELDTGVMVAGSLLDNGLTISIFMSAEDGRVFTVQPLADVDTDSTDDLYVVFESVDVMPHGGLCGGAVIPEGLHHLAAERFGATERGTGLLTTELAIDADVQFHNIFGSEAATVADIENVMNGVNVVYERDVDVTFVLPTIIVRTTTASNPYTTNVSENLLDQFRVEWLTAQAGIDRDLAHLFTGRNLSGSTIGIAFLGVVCNRNLGYGLSQSRFTTSFNNRVALTAHEIGHNFNAPHCSGASCRIMCAGLGGCGGIGSPNFGAASSNTINTFASNRGCLDSGPVPLSIPFNEGFDDAGAFDPEVWPVVVGAEVNTDASNPITPPNTANLDGTDSLESFDFSAASLLGQSLLVEFATQHQGVASGETLIVEYLKNNLLWETLATVASDGVDQSGFTRHSLSLPLLGFHDGLRIRFTAAGSDATDDWYVDDVYVGEFRGQPIPWEDDLEGGFDNTDWDTIIGAAVTTAGVNEPSGTDSAELDNTDSIESVNLLLDPGLVFTTHYFRFSTEHRGVESGESLLVEYLNLNLAWAELTTLTSDGVDQSAYELNQIQAPFLAFHNEMRLRFTAQGNESDDDWFIDDIAVTSEFIEPNDCPADLAAPFGTLDFFDVLEYLALFDAEDPGADVAAPFGTWDFFDVLEYLALFDAGCP